MVTNKQLKKMIAIERKKQAKRNKIIGSKTEKSRLKKQLFNLKYGNQIKVVKKVGRGFKVTGKALKRGGSNLTENVSRATSSFNKQRKKKQGIGGFLQRIADNQ